MTARALLARASELAGMQINYCQLTYAILKGELDQPERLADGWRQFTEKHAEQLALYCKKRAHRRTRKPSASR